MELIIVSFLTLVITGTLLILFLKKHFAKIEAATQAREALLIAEIHRAREGVAAGVATVIGDINQLVGGADHGVFLVKEEGIAMLHEALSGLLKAVDTMTGSSFVTKTDAVQNAVAAVQAKHESELAVLHAQLAQAQAPSQFQAQIQAQAQEPAPLPQAQPEPQPVPQPVPQPDPDPAPVPVLEQAPVQQPVPAIDPATGLMTNG